MPTDGNKLPSIFSFVHARSLLGCLVQPCNCFACESPTDNKENGVFVVLGSRLCGNLLGSEKTAVGKLIDYEFSKPAILHTEEVPGLYK